MGTQPSPTDDKTSRSKVQPRIPEIPEMSGIMLKPNKTVLFQVEVTDNWFDIMSGIERNLNMIANLIYSNFNRNSRIVE